MNRVLICAALASALAAQPVPFGKELRSENGPGVFVFPIDPDARAAQFGIYRDPTLVSGAMVVILPTSEEVDQFIVSVRYAPVPDIQASVGASGSSVIGWWISAPNEQGKVILSQVVRRARGQLSGWTPVFFFLGTTTLDGIEVTESKPAGVTRSAPLLPTAPDGESRRHPPRAKPT